MQPNCLLPQTVVNDNRGTVGSYAAGTVILSPLHIHLGRIFMKKYLYDPNMQVDICIFMEIC